MHHSAGEWRATSAHLISTALFQEGRRSVTLPRLPGEPEPDALTALAQGALDGREREAFKPVKTQASVRIGSKNPPFMVKGMGLIAGYDCLCFGDTDPTSEGMQTVDAAQRSIKLKHIVFQGRHSLEDAMELETMLEWSDITCIACKQTVLF
jgi:hypothetical protein